MQSSNRPAAPTRSGTGWFSPLTAFERGALMKPTIVAAALACAWLSACTTTKPSPIDELSLQEGLQRVDSKVADAVYRRPEARMSEYSKVLLRPIQVQFAKNWDPSKNGS